MNPFHSAGPPKAAFMNPVQRGQLQYIVQRGVTPLDIVVSTLGGPIYHCCGAGDIDNSCCNPTGIEPLLSHDTNYHDTVIFGAIYKELESVFDIDMMCQCHGQ